MDRTATVHRVSKNQTWLSANTHRHMRWSPWDQHQWRKKEAEEEGREKLRCNISPTTGLAKPIGAIELEWSSELSWVGAWSCCCSVAKACLFATPWAAAGQASLSFTISQSLPKFMYIESVMSSNHLILYGPLLLLPSVLPRIRVFSNESALCIRWPKYWSFSFSISSFYEYSRLISFMIGWLDLLAVQGTQESSPTPQFKSINSLVLSLLYGPTLTSIHDCWKDHSLEWTFVGKVMS